ncbi:hypothetical protein Nmel_003512 [Mimus melanotis]
MIPLIHQWDETSPSTLGSTTRPPFLFPALELPAWTLLCWAREALRPKVFPQTSHL